MISSNAIIFAWVPLKRPRRKITTHPKLSSWVKNERSYTTIPLHAVGACTCAIHLLHLLSELSGSAGQLAPSDFDRHASPYSKTGRPLCESETDAPSVPLELEFSMLSRLETKVMNTASGTQYSMWLSICIFHTGNGWWRTGSHTSHIKKINTL